MKLNKLRMNGHVVIEDWTIARPHRFDSLYLKGMPFQVFDGPAENIVCLAFEFGSGARRSLFDRQSVGIETISARLIAIILLDELNIRIRK